MTVVPGSIQSRIMFISVSVVLSRTGTRNVLPDPRSTPPNTHWHLTGCPLLYLCRPNLLSSISTVVLGPLLTEQPSRNTSVVSLQNMPQSAMVCELRRYSLWILVALSRHTVSYVISRISWRVRLLSWNHDPCLMNANWLQLTPATLLLHRQWNPSEVLESADHVISRPQVLHSIVLRSRPMSCREATAREWSQKR